MEKWWSSPVLNLFYRPRCEDFELLLRMLPHRAVHLRTSPHRHKWCLGRAVPVWHHELQNVRPKKKDKFQVQNVSIFWEVSKMMDVNPKVILDVWTEKTCSLVSVETSLCMRFVYSWHRMDTENNHELDARAMFQTLKVLLTTCWRMECLSNPSGTSPT